MKQARSPVKCAHLGPLTNTTTHMPPGTTALRIAQTAPPVDWVKPGLFSVITTRRKIVSNVAKENTTPPHERLALAAACLALPVGTEY